MRRFSALVAGLAVVAAVLSVGLGPILANSAPVWSAYYYNPSGHALGGPVRAGSDPAGAATLSFAPGYVALLTTGDASLTGDLTGKTLSATVSVSGVTGTFIDQNGGGCTPANPSVRLYFTSPAGSGPSFPLPGGPAGSPGGGTPSGFYSQFWWSNPVSLPLTPTASGTITVSLDPSKWSDWNGQRGDSSNAVTAAFQDAVARVESVGLSFGGGCFFENGVTTDNGSGTLTATLVKS